MPNTSNESLKSNGKHILVYLGTWITSAFFIIMGLRYNIYTTAVLGVFHEFLGCLLLLILVQKISNVLANRRYEYVEEDDEDLSEDINSDEYYESDEYLESDIPDEYYVEDEEYIEDEEYEEQQNDTYEVDYSNRFFSVLYPVFLVLISLGTIFIQIVLLRSFASLTEYSKPPILIGIVQIVFSFVYLMLVQWFFSESTDYDQNRMYGYICRAGQIIAFLTGIAVMLRAFGFNQFESVFVYFTAIFCIIVYIDFLISGIQKILSKDLNDIQVIKLNIIVAMFGQRDSETSFIDLIEEKIGVSLRSAWTIKFVRKLIPIAVIVIIVTLWGLTSLVTIDPQSEGIVYRFGQIVSEEPLTPGLHAKLPWPIDNVKTYPVYKTQYLTVGYNTGEDQIDQNQNYLWTSVHGEEYKLLLGDGKELVSINMTVHYKINDLTDYVMSYSKPEDILSAKAYETMLKLIVASDLDGLLSKDRASLANTVKSELQVISNDEKCGLEITDVAITSIHPPVEIATSYQELVSASIQKQVIISEALTESERAVPAAEQEKSEIIKDAEVDYNTRHGDAVSEATQTTSSIEAYNYYTESYKLRKWLSAMTSYLKNNYFYIIDEDVVDGDGEIWMNNGSGY